MRIVLFCMSLTISIQLIAQRPTVNSIHIEIKRMNNITLSTDDMIVSYSGLNRFMGTKVASYLSDGGDLSLFKNYAVLNSEDGRLSLNHNFAFTNNTGRIKSLLTAGVRADVSNAFSAIINDSKFSDDLGVSIKYTWIGRGSAFFDSQKQKQLEAVASEVGPQKTKMNRQRAIIVSELFSEMKEEANTFEAMLLALDPNDLSLNDDLASLQNEARDEFYDDLRTNYLKEFAKREAKALEGEGTHNLITSHWISLAMYIPLTASKYSVAQSFSTNFTDKELYPWEFNGSLNWIFESRRWGRLFAHLTAGVFNNSSVKSKGVDEIDLNSYKVLGGTDTLSYALLDTDDAYVGDYSDFITPILKGQLVWFPPKLNVGVSVLVEQNFGDYNPLNGKIGIPVRLKGKDDDSFVNFELQVRATDINGTMDPDKSLSKKTTYGISVGLPFSSFVN